MLCSLGDLFDVAVLAIDGTIGRVRNFLFDDRSWTIRDLVVEVGWLARRDVVLSVSTIDQPDWGQKLLRVRLTREQVRYSPDVDSRKPVARQQEIAMREYFGWPAYRERSRNAEFPPISFRAGREFPVRTEEDAHLRSTEGMAGYSVWSEHVELGRLADFIVDEASWHIGYLDVKMGDWLHRRSLLISTRWVTSVSWADHRVNLDETQRQVQAG